MDNKDDQDLLHIQKSTFFDAMAQMMDELWCTDGRGTSNFCKL